MRVEMVFDGGRLNVLPLKEISTPTLGSPSVENGYELAGGITGGTVEVSSLETGSVDAGPLVVDPDGTSASIELVAVGPGRVLVSGKVSLASTGTSEVFGGFTHYHPPLASSADPSARTSAPAITAAKKAFAAACLLLVCLLGMTSATAGEPQRQLGERKFVGGITCDEGVEAEWQAAIEHNRRLDRLAGEVFQPRLSHTSESRRCLCGPDCACGDDCRCGEVAVAGEAEAAAAAGGGNVRRAALKMFLRRQATKAVLRGDRAKARQLREALNDDDTLDSIVDAVGSDEKLSLPATADGAIVDQIIKFLQWLLDHADEILTIVMKIIPLFAEPAQPAAALLDAPPGWLETPLAMAC